MSATKKMIAADLEPSVVECLRAKAAVQGLSLRDYSARVLESASLERPNVDVEPRSERSSSVSAEEAGAATLDYVPVRLRVKDDLAAGVSPYERPRPPIREGETTLPPDPEEASRTFGRELQLVRRTSTWRNLVQEGLFEELLRASIEE
jgi:hypothetical protein